MRLSAIVLAVFVSFASAKVCVMPLSARVDAVDASFTDADLGAECEAKGFCYAPGPANFPSAAWCYHPAPEGSAAGVGNCAVEASSKRACESEDGSYGLEQCASLGCCWQENEGGEPWCYMAEGEGIAPREEL